MDYLASTLLLAACIILSAFFSGTEVALVSIGTLKLRNLVKHGKRGAVALKKLKDNPDHMLITILIGNNVVNIAASALATYIATSYFGSAGVGIATGVMTFIILVAGEITPKNVAASHNERIALAVAPAILTLERILYPLVVFFASISSFTRRMYIPKKRRPIITEDELKTIVEVGVEEKVLEKKERELIEGVLEFNDIAVREVMTPIVKMVGFEADRTVAESVPRINQTRHSRFPVYEDGNRDKIVGIVHVKDFMRAWEKDPKQRLRDIARKPVFVSREAIISELFREMQKRRVHIAIVINEFGGVEGLVTMENLIEEIVGEIEDESDDVSPDLLIKKNKNTVIVHGETDLEKLERFYKTELPREGDYQTVSGLLHYQLKRIPRKGSKVDVAGLRFEVTKISHRRPERVTVTKIRNG